MLSSLGFPETCPAMSRCLPACLSAGPVELPLVLRAHGHPAALLHVGDDDGLVHVGAVGHLGGHGEAEAGEVCAGVEREDNSQS